MGEQLVAKATVKGQIEKLPEKLQFEAVRQTMELMMNKKLLEEQKAKLEKELAGMCFVFRETEAIPLKNKRKFRSDVPFVSQSSGEFWTRVFRKTCSKGIFFVALLMAIKFLAECSHIDVLEVAVDFIAGHFLPVVGFALVGFAILNVAEVRYKDKTNAAKLKKLNVEIARFNKDVDEQNAVIRQKNLQAQEADKKRRISEEKIYQTKLLEMQKLLRACKEAYQKVLTGIEQLQSKNVIPGMFFEEGNRMLPVVYYLMQNRITTKLYDLDGALEKARSMLQEEAMLNKVEQIVSNTARTVGELNLLNGRMQGVHDKLDFLGDQMSSLAMSQERMNAALVELSSSSQDVVAAIESQSNTLAAQNRTLASNIDKSIRENSLGRYVYDTSLFGTTINARDIKKFVEKHS